MLRLFVPAYHPRSPSDPPNAAPRRVDMSDGSPVRALIAEAEALGIAVEHDVPCRAGDR